MTMRQTAVTIIDKYKMLSEGDAVLIGVSGGPDSVALLYLLLGLRKKYGIKVSVAHLNHGFRKEAAEEAEFVKSLAASQDIPSVIRFIDVPALMGKEGLSAQEAARNARYAFFEEVAKETGANKIALAHTADDQAETVLMRLLRGAGALGLGGIPPVRKMSGDGPVIIRPLIECTRRDIERYLSDNGIFFVTDSSNLKMDYMRNRVRMELIPFLESYNPNVKAAFVRTGEIIHTDDEFLDMEAEKAYRAVVVHQSAVGCQEMAIEIKRLKTLHPAISARVIRKGIEEVKGDLRRISFRHISDIITLIDSGEGRWSLHLPGITVTREYGELILKKGKGRR